MSTYPKSSTIFQHVESEPDTYLIQIIDTEQNQLLASYSETLLQISILEVGGVDHYEVLEVATYPDNAQKIILDASEEGAQSIAFSIQNSSGLGTIDFRDGLRTHTWDLEGAPALFLANNPEGVEGVIWSGVHNDYVSVAYDYQHISS